MKDLSKLWLSALRDHALLGLPSQFGPQLPPDGGAFYSPDTMESARSHYRSSWPAFLQAAAFWLSDEGFDSEVTTTHLDKKQRNTGWFHLLLGLCVEALVSPIPEDGANPVIASLQSMAELLAAQWPRQCLGGNHSLAIEVLAVMHRVVLTYHKPEHQALAARIVNQVVSSAVESLTDQADTNDYPKPTLASVDDLAVGKSVVFAALQVAICLLFQRFPSLRLIGLQQSLQVQKVHPVQSVHTPDTSIALVIETLHQVLSLCDVPAAINILPSILMLIVRVLEEHIGSSSVIVSACIQALQVIMSKELPADKQASDSWVELLCSAYVTLLEMTKTQLQMVDQCSAVWYSNVLVLLGSILLSAPDVVTAVKELQEKCCDVFQRGIENRDIQVK